MGTRLLPQLSKPQTRLPQILLECGELAKSERVIRKLITYLP